MKIINKSKLIKAIKIITSNFTNFDTCYSEWSDYFERDIIVGGCGFIDIGNNKSFYYKFENEELKVYYNDNWIDEKDDGEQVVQENNKLFFSIKIKR